MSSHSASYLSGPPTLSFYSRSACRMRTNRRIRKREEARGVAGPLGWAGGSKFQFTSGLISKSISIDATHRGQHCGNHIRRSQNRPPPYTEIDLIQDRFIPGHFGSRLCSSQNRQTDTATACSDSCNKPDVSRLDNLLSECDGKSYLDLVFDFYSPSGNFRWCDSEI